MNYKEIYKYEQNNRGSQATTRISRAEQERLGEKTLDSLLMIHAFAAHFDQLRKSTSSKFRDLDMLVQGYQKATQ